MNKLKLLAVASLVLVSSSAFAGKTNTCPCLTDWEEQAATQCADWSTTSKQSLGRGDSVASLAWGKYDVDNNCVVLQAVPSACSWETGLTDLYSSRCNVGAGDHAISGGFDGLSKSEERDCNAAIRAIERALEACPPLPQAGESCDVDGIIGFDYVDAGLYGCSASENELRCGPAYSYVWTCGSGG